MRRAFFFDLLYLKEFKSEFHRSDLDEVNFAFSLILDVTRLIANNENFRGSDTERMSKAFDFMRGKIGIIVPFPKFVVAYNMAFKNI